MPVQAVLLKRPVAASTGVRVLDMVPSSIHRPLRAAPEKTMLIGAGRWLSECCRPVPWPNFVHRTVGPLHGAVVEDAGRQQESTRAIRQVIDPVCTAAGSEPRITRRT